MEVQCLALKDLTSPRKRVSVHEEDVQDEGQGEHKENVYTGKRSTPLKSAESAVPALLMNRRGGGGGGGTPDLAHLTPIKHGALAEPWTPTANLKMLISAASPDIRDREMKKVLFRPIENDRDAARPAAAADDPEADDLGQLDAAAEEEEDDAEKKPSRKQKSLGLLCQKFLALYPDYPPLNHPIWISLDEVANNLGVERRRIYDIVNVLESLMIVGRIAKNSYTWFGRQRLEATLQELQQRGLQQGYHLQMEPTAGAWAGGPGCEEDGAEGDAGNAGSNRKDKSLRIMSQKFVMLFLVSKTKTVTLDAAAKVLIEEGQDSSSHSKYKTKVRRLYDIANVLTSLGLIKKVHVREERGRKPAFKWLGPAEFGGNAGSALNVAADAPPGRKMARHASFHVAPPSAAALRQVSSAPSSPRPGLTGLRHQPVDYSRKSASNGAVCQLQFGNSADSCSSASLQTIVAPGNSPAPPPPSGRPALLTPHLFAPSPPPHCLAYLPSLSQPSVVMLYRAPDGQPPPPEPEEGRKRSREEEEEEEEEAVKKRRTSALEDFQMCAEPREQVAVSSDHAQPSHYLFLPNNAGFNSLNLVLSADPPSAGVALPPGGLPTLALPYFLLPSPYPLVTGGPQQQQHSADARLSFGVPAVMPPAHFMLGASPYGCLTPDAGAPPASSPSTTPERRRLRGAEAPTPPSPSGQQDTMTPRTPKEVDASSSFFQTPGTQGSGVSAAPAARRKASAQRRLDVGHPLTR